MVHSGFNKWTGDGASRISVGNKRQQIWHVVFMYACANLLSLVPQCSGILSQVHIKTTPERYPELGGI